jgi:TolB-like protein
MKRLVPSFTIIISIILFSVPQIFAQVKITIAVLNFESKNIEQETAEAVSDILGTELFNTNRFNVVERQAIEKILEEHKLQMSGITDMDQAAQIGKMLNVQKIMIGSVSKLGSNYIINTRLVNVETGELDLAEKIQSGGGESGLPTAISSLAKNIANKVKLEGAVLQVNQQTIMINLGSHHGITQNQILQVVRVGESIKDLDGNIIGKNEDKLGLIKVTEVKEKYSNAIVLESKLPFMRGDKVRETAQTVKAEPDNNNTQNYKTYTKKKTDEKKKVVAPPPVF